MGTAGLPPPAPWQWTPLLNQIGLNVTPPNSSADLNLSASGTAGLNAQGLTETVRAPIQDSFLSTSLLTPWGSQALVLNLGGSNHSVNKVMQTATMLSSDVDPDDGQVHIRLAFAPVLEQSGHVPEKEPYVFIEVRNLSRGNTQLYRYFASPQSTGVSWMAGTQNGKPFVYTPWQAIDIAPGAAQLAVGDQVTLSIVAAGCAQGGHEGHVYVDGVGSLFAPGLSVQASAPTQVLPGSNLSYELRYANTGSTATGVQLFAQTPPNASFVSLVAPPGATCHSPAVGSPGEVNCSLGYPLANGQQGQWRMTVQVNPAAPAGLDALSPMLYGINSSSSPVLRGAPPMTEVLDPGVHHTVTLSKSGDGAGSVSSSPPGLVCDSTCAATSTELFNGRQITLSASPDAASYFAGWSGDCSGQADCVLTMWGAPRNAVANFSPLPVATLNSAQLVLQQGQAISPLHPVSGSRGTAPLSYAITPALPPGLSLDPDSGALSGTPTSLADARSYTVTVSDASQHSAMASFTLAVVAALQEQRIHFDSAPVLAVGGSATIGASASSGLTLSLSSLTPETCSVSGNMVHGLGVGPCRLMASQGGDSRYAATQSRSDPFPVTLRNARLPAGGTGPGGTIDLSFSGGGNGATLTRAQVLLSAPSPVPASLGFPYGWLDFSIGQLDPGGSATVTLSYPQALPPGTRYWKYGHQTAGDAAHWYVFDGAVIAGNTVTLPLNDGGSGDDDGVADGNISDPGGVGFASDGMAVPALSPAGMALLALALAVLGSWTSGARRRARPAAGD